MSRRASKKNASLFSLIPGKIYRFKKKNIFFDSQYWDKFNLVYVLEEKDYYYSLLFLDTAIVEKRFPISFLKSFLTWEEVKTEK